MARSLRHSTPSKRSLMPPTASKSISYADAGVDIDRAKRTKQRIRYLAHKTFTRGVLSEIGGFGGLFALDRKRYARIIVENNLSAD